jgi:hypothetical protein
MSPDAEKDAAYDGILSFEKESFLPAQNRKKTERY